MRWRNWAMVHGRARRSSAPQLMTARTVSPLRSQVVRSTATKGLRPRARVAKAADDVADGVFVTLKLGDDEIEVGARERRLEIGRAGDRFDVAEAQRLQSAKRALAIHVGRIIEAGSHPPEVKLSHSPNP